MSGIGVAVGDAASAFLADSTVGLVGRVVASYVIAVWLAVALWAFVDMRRRTSHLAAAYAAAALVILASPLLFPLAVVVLRILRPAAFAAEHRLALTRESVLETNFVEPRCPVCQRVIDADWLVCPTCRQLLAHVCGECGRTGDLDWPVCAWCAEELDWPGTADLRAPGLIAQA